MQALFTIYSLSTPPWEEEVFKCWAVTRSAGLLFFRHPRELSTNTLAGRREQRHISLVGSSQNAYYCYYYCSKLHIFVWTQFIRINRQCMKRSGPHPGKNKPFIACISNWRQTNIFWRLENLFCFGACKFLPLSGQSRKLENTLRKRLSGEHYPVWKSRSSHVAEIWDTGIPWA